MIVSTCYTRASLLVGVVFCLASSGSCQSEPYVTLQNDGPAVQGAPLQFTSRVLELNTTAPYQLLFRFADNNEPKHQYSVTTNNSASASYLIPGDEFARSGSFTMKVRVFLLDDALHENLIGERLSSYKITLLLNGEITVAQPWLPNRDAWHVSSRNTTILRTELLDPHGFLNGSSNIKYIWSINNIETYPPYNSSVLSYNFTTIGSNSVKSIVIAYFDSSSGDSGDTWRNVTAKYGSFSKTVYVDDPISFVHVTGDSWLRNGAMLNLTVSCNGTGPWQYCVFIHPAGYNTTGNETCRDESVTLYDRCLVSYQRYLTKNSTYTAVFIFSNHVNRRIASVTISVNVETVTQLSYYVVPLSCTLMAILFILFGSIQMIKSRRNYNIEIADFDIEPSPARRGERVTLDSTPAAGDGEITFWRRVCATVGSVQWRRRLPGRRRGHPLSSDQQPILAPGRSHRLSYGIVEGYDED